MGRGVWGSFWEWRLKDQVGQAGGQPVEGLGHGSAEFWGRWKTRPEPRVPEGPRAAGTRQVEGSPQPWRGQLGSC